MRKPGSSISGLETAVYMRKPGSSITQLYKDSSVDGIELTPLASRTRGIYRSTGLNSQPCHESEAKQRKFVHLPKLATPLVQHRDYSTSRRPNTKQEYL